MTDVHTDVKTDDEKDSENLPRRKMATIAMGALLGAAALSKKEANALASSDAPILAKIDATLVAMSANVATVASAVKKELENFTEFMKPFTETYNNVKKVSDSWNELMGQMNKVMEATEKSRDFLQSLIDKDSNIFYVQAKQLSSYVTNLIAGNSDWAKVRLRKFDWYSQALVRAIEDIAAHYNDMYNAWERASHGPNSPQDKIFVAGANQQLKAFYNEVRAYAFSKQFDDIQEQVRNDKKAGKIPKDKSESEIVSELSKQMLIQLQIAQYSATVDILNSVNTLVLSKNPGAFKIPKGMKIPKPEDFKNAFDAATKGESFPGNYFRDRS
ncbi:hypothetical protein [Fluviispira sanaruensis]|uniref:Uncharacterized protein n=1 Tax=Fluviispira sanaruensis TaxID=2493639 RepID=A0A4P2VYE1_FLUSA|nr:hypothetical protein [Fluviispira sanaruensis]BBH54715.1 hypothetical protein JCM31447_31890 [Fluviispira sanaruensis]